jgi:MFS family permease
LKEGFKYTYEFIPIRYVLIMLALVSLVGMSMNVLMPIYTKDILGGGSHILGFLMGAMGLGSLFGGLGLVLRNSNRGLEKKILMAVFILGLSLMCLPVLKSYWFGMIIMSLFGFGMITQMISSNTMIQTLVDDDKRGRVMSIYVMSFMGTAPLGSLLAGSMADVIGVLNTSFIAGFGCIIAGIFFSSKISKIKEISEMVYDHEMEPADE